MKAKFYFTLVSLFLLLGVHSANATERLLGACSSCNTEFQYKHYAKSIVINKAIRESRDVQADVHVINGLTAVHYSFRVTHIPAEPGMPAHTFAHAITPNTTVLEHLDGLSAGLYEYFHEELPVVDPSIAGSAYDMIGSSSTRAAVVNFIKANQQGFNGLMNGLTSFLTQFTATQMELESPMFKIEFEDGSVAFYEVSIEMTAQAISSSVEQRFELKYVQDTQLNTIKFNAYGDAAIVRGEYGFAGAYDSANSFIDALIRLGVPVIFAGEGLPVKIQCRGPVGDEKCTVSPE